MSTKLGATGAMSLLSELVNDGGPPCRQVHLQTSRDGKTIVMIDVDQRKAGVLRAVCYEITPAELIAAIRAHGAELSQTSDEALDAVESMQKALPSSPPSSSPSSATLSASLPVSGTASASTSLPASPPPSTIDAAPAASMS